MGSVRTFLVACGVWYLCNLVLLWPPLYAGALPLIYPGTDLQQDQPVFGLLLDAWLIVGIQLAAIGLVSLLGARRPEKYLALIPVIVLTELVGAAWDIYSMAFRGEAAWVGAVTLIIHAILIFFAWRAWSAAHGKVAVQA